MDVDFQNSGRPEFPVAETHGIALWPKHRLLVDSRGLGWREVYTSLAIEDSWRRTLGASRHICLAYCQHGAAEVTRKIEGESAIAKADLRSRLFGVVPEGRASDWALRGKPSIQLIYLDRAMVEQLALDVFDLDPSRLFVAPKLGFADPMLEQLALELLDCGRGEMRGGLYPDHLARMIALRVLRTHVDRPGRSPARLASADLSPRLRRVCEFIETYLSEDLGLERLASEAGVGAHAFTAAFHRAVGLTPHRYVLERRVERAKTLLREGDTPLADVALSCGFASQSHLTTTFRRMLGCTPAEFRRG